MHALTARDIVQVWEWGQDRHPVDRALLLLELAEPDLAPEQAAALTIGQRNARLLALREQTLGPTLQGTADCPQCGAPLAFTFDAAAIRLPEPAPGPYTLAVAGYQVEFRLPNSLDLAALAGYEDAGAAGYVLAERCVLHASHEGQDLAPADLPAEAVAALAEAAAEHDPQAEMRFRLQCADCGHDWPAPFDIASFLWAEISAVARRLLQDVAILARSFGWREADILAMSAPRRQFYLEQAA